MIGFESFILKWFFFVFLAKKNLQVCMRTKKKTYHPREQNPIQKKKKNSHLESI